MGHSINYAPRGRGRGRGSSLPYIFIAYYMQKKTREYPRTVELGFPINENFNFPAGLLHCLLVEAHRVGEDNLVKDPATRCDKMGHFPAILSFWEHRSPSQIIASVPSKIAAVWPVCYL